MKPGKQDWNPRQYAQNARFVSDLGMSVVELLAPKSHERILDLGCGDGALTIRLLDYGCDVVGVDSSPAMIDAARSLGVDAHVIDARKLGFTDEFDAVFSNAALHWMAAPDKVIRGVWRALKVGGRFVGEFGGHGNVASITAALESALQARGIAVPKPWYFPKPENYSKLLETQGFSVDYIELIPRPTPLPGDMNSWLETFAQPFTGAIVPAERQQLIDEITTALRPMLCDARGCWHVDYTRLRFSASKPVAK